MTIIINSYYKTKSYIIEIRTIINDPSLKKHTKQYIKSNTPILTSNFHESLIINDFFTFNSIIINILQTYKLPQDRIYNILQNFNDFNSVSFQLNNNREIILSKLYVGTPKWRL